MQHATIIGASSQHALAINAEEFAKTLATFLPPVTGGLALAVSGGPDSMALAFCMKRWAAEKDLPLQAFIVDHKLRTTSGSEAEATKNELEKLGLPAEILRWDHGPVTSRLHKTARKARYELLLQACRRQALTNVFLAHHRDDQAETILMRFAKGSGIDGLAGMPPDSKQNGIRLLRPFLPFSKDRLIATCEAAKLSYVIDASNSSEKYARGRLRRVMPLLEQEGLNSERLSDLGARASEASKALNYYTRIFLKDFARQDIAGTIRIDRAELHQLPRAIIERAIVATLQEINRTNDYAPEHFSLSRLIDELLDHTPFLPQTLHGCLLSVTEKHLVVMRECASVTDAPTIRPGETVTWDGRWSVSLDPNSPAKEYVIRPLSNPPHELLDQLAPGLRRAVPQGRARSTLPALYLPLNGAPNLAIIPHLTGNKAGNNAYAAILTSQITSQ